MTGFILIYILSVFIVLMVTGIEFFQNKIKITRDDITLKNICKWFCYIFMPIINTALIVLMIYFMIESIWDKPIFGKSKEK